VIVIVLIDGGMLNNHFIANGSPSVPVKNFKNQLIFDEDMHNDLGRFLFNHSIAVVCITVNIFLASYLRRDVKIVSFHISVPSNFR